VAGRRVKTAGRWLQIKLSSSTYLTDDWISKQKPSAKRCLPEKPSSERSLSPKSTQLKM
jgi:hypothetical protein